MVFASEKPNRRLGRQNRFSLLASTYIESIVVLFRFGPNLGVTILIELRIDNFATMLSEVGWFGTTRNRLPTVEE